MAEWVDRSLGRKSELELPPLIGQILSGRGIHTHEEVEEIFHPKLANLKDPFSIDQMDLAVERLLKALEEKEIIGIYGDFDLDGTPAVALLKKGLELLGFQGICFYQPRRLREGYGFSLKGVDVLKSQKVSLIVTVDVGITDIETASYAKSQGVDVIVTDHHQPKEELPLSAVAILNPNKGGCPSRLTYLSGTGVAFYLILGLRKKMRDLGLLKSDFNPKDLLDCFVIGTLTDMVPLVKENRILVKHGLLQLHKTQRPGLRLLLKSLGMDRPLSSQDVAIRFAPKLNALSRMDTDLLPLDIFLETDGVKSSTLVSEMIEINKRRIKLQEEAQRVAEEKVKEAGVSGYAWVCSESFHMGVIGLVATNLCDKFGVPAFVGTMNDKGHIVGSSRRPKGSLSCLLEALGSAEDALLRFGGHSPAAGFELELGKRDEFNRKLEQFYRDKGEDVKEDAALYFDGEASIGELNHQFMKWYDGLEPFGAEFEPPIIKFSSVCVEDFRTLRGGHFKMRLRSSEGSIEAMWFFPPKDISEKELKGAAVDILATPQWNYFMGKKTLQLVVQDLKAVNSEFKGAF